MQKQWKRWKSKARRHDAKRCRAFIFYGLSLDEVLQVALGDLSMTDQLHNVLVVDDDEGSRDVFCKLLTSAGYAVQSAYDGLDAIHHMEKTQFHVVLTDVCMPHMDGFELLAKIRDRWPDSRVIVHSGIVSVQVGRHAKAEGAHAFLSKSAGTAELLNTIASAFSTACATPSEMTH